MNSNRRDDILLHFGVKGMRWGVRKAITSGKTRIKDELGSMKREKSWKAVAKKASSLSDDELKTAGTRVRLENDLKTLASRKEYIKREALPTKELEARIQRLRLEKALKTSAKQATREQQEMGQSVVNLAKDIAIGKAAGGATKAVVTRELKKRGQRAAIRKATQVVDSIIGYDLSL